MATATLERPAHASPPEVENPLDEQLALDLGHLRHMPDWEQLMEQGTTPALLVGGERRANAR
jgi:hypothetical protein